MKYTLMNVPMSLATQQGIKTQTRREIKIPKDFNIESVETTWAKDGGIFDIRFDDYDSDETIFIKPPYKIGEVLWVREPAKVVSSNIYDGSITFEYQTDGKQITLRDEINRFIGNYTSSPKNWYFTKNWVLRKQGIPNGCIREMARTFIRITNIRVERLDDISESDAEKEGIKYIGGGRIADSEDCFDVHFYYGDLIEDGYGYENEFFEYADEAFASLWESINGKNSFDNRWVWVIEYELISKEEVL